MIMFGIVLLIVGVALLICWLIEWTTECSFMKKILISGVIMTIVGIIFIVYDVTSPVKSYVKTYTTYKIGSYVLSNEVVVEDYRYKSTRWGAVYNSKHKYKVLSIGNEVKEVLIED